MKRIIAVLLMLLWILSGCAKPDRPQQDAGVSPEQQSENQEIPADPKIDPQWKDPSITDAQRRWFFDLVKEYRIDAMYDFDAEHPMELDWFKYYCAYFVKDEDKRQENGKLFYKGRAVEEIAKWFGMSYGLKDEEEVILKVGSLLDDPFAELIQYKEEKVDGKTLITARCINYGFDRYMSNDRVESELNYPTDRAMVLKGEVQGFQRYYVTDVAFYTEDGKTPTQFIYAKDYPQWSIEDGSMTVPEFK